MDIRNIFICYQNGPAADIADRLCGVFRKRRYSVYNETLMEHIEHCKDFIVILDDGALDESSPCVIQIREALEYGKNIIPVVMDGFMLPDRLPEGLDSIRDMRMVYAQPNNIEAMADELARGYLVSRPQGREANKSAIKAVIAVLVVAALFVLAWFVVLPNVLKGTMTGTVRSTFDGCELEGVEIWCYNGSDVTEPGGKMRTAVVTDETGRYMIELPKGSYSLILSKDGYVTAAINAECIRGEHDDQDADLDAVLYDVGGIVSSTYTQSALSGVTLTGTAGLRDNVPIELTTDENGRYTTQLPGGEYELQLAKDEFIPATLTVAAADGQADQNAALDPVLHDVTGVIRDAVDNTVLSGVSVALYEGGSTSGTALFTATTASDGRFCFAVPAGNYTLTMSKPEYVDDTAALVSAEGQGAQDVTLMPNRGEVTGVISNATDVQPLSGVTVQIFRGADITEPTEAPIASSTTGNDGAYAAMLPEGEYTVIMTKEGFVTEHMNISIVTGRRENKNAVLSPVMSNDEYRFVLTWGENPRDLDSHIFGSASADRFSGYHVFYSAKEGSRGASHAELDVDDTNGCGPETTTVKVTRDMTYKFCVYDYTNGQNSTVLKSSGATVKVYRGNDLVRTYQVPNANGGVWHVCWIRGGEIVDINRVDNASNQGEW